MIRSLLRASDIALDSCSLVHFIFASLLNLIALLQACPVGLLGRFAPLGFTLSCLGGFAPSSFELCVLNGFAPFGFVLKSCPLRSHTFRIYNLFFSNKCLNRPLFLLLYVFLFFYIFFYVAYSI